MLNLITGGAGTGKSYEMMERIGKAVSDGKKVYVIVPDQFDFEYNRMLYNHMGMEKFNRVEVLGFSRLARSIFIRYGGLRGKYADDTVRTAVMFKALSELTAKKALSFYDRQAKRAVFISDALGFVRDLSANNITPEELSDKLSLMSDSVREKAGDISLICSEYTRLLTEYGFKDSRTDISEAAKKAAENDCFRDTVFFVDEFKSFTPDEYLLLAEIIRGSEALTVCLTTEDKTPVGYSLFETVNRTAAKLVQFAKEAEVKVERTIMTENKRFKAPELEFVSKHILRSGKHTFEGECSAVKVYEAAEPYAEADFICAEICRLVRQGYNYSDITVMARCKENYSSILDAAFERSGIPYYSDENGGVGHKALMIFVSTAIRLAAAKTPSTEDYLRYIKTGYTGLDTEQTDILEEYCYKWNVEGKMWNEPFIIWDKNSSHDQNLTHDEIAEQARLTVTSPIEKLRNAFRKSSAAEKCRALDDFLEDVQIREQIRDSILAVSSDDAEMLSAARESKQLWELLCSLLQTLYSALGDTEISPSEFSDLFGIAASGLKLSAPPQKLDEVQFTALHMARLANPKVIFIIGANEGNLPFAAKPSYLLTDRDLAALKDCGIEISGSCADKTAEEKFAAYAALSGASERLYITYPIASVGGGALYPAAAVKQAEGMFTSDIKLTAHKLGLLYFCTTEQNGYYQYIQNFHRRDEDCASLRFALEEYDPKNKAKFEYLDNPAERNRHRLYSKKNAEGIFGKNVSLSASRLEDYRLCPFVYFCKKGLKIYPRERVELNAPAQGTAIHSCLCDILSEKGKADFLAMSDKEIFDEVDKKLQAYYAGESVGSGYGKTCRYKAAYGRLTETLTDILVHLRTEFAQSKFVPDAFEYTLSREGNEAPVKLTASDGSTVYFSGAVDRVDIFDDGGETYVRVVDYKSGTKVFSLEDLYYGINMQMLLYLFALTDPEVPVNKGRYHAALPAGVLYMPAKDARPSLPREYTDEDYSSAKNKAYKMDGLVLSDLTIVSAMEEQANGVFIPVKVTKDNSFYKMSKIISEEQLENLRRFSYELIKETAELIKSGVIEANPLVHGKKTPCAYCDYRSVCGNFPNIIHREYSPDALDRMNDILNGTDRGKQV